jgi:hypothetical protein
VKRRSTIAGVLAVLALALAPAAASAAKRYAAPDGTGPAASCPKSDPCSLIAAVEDPSVADGDKVILKRGNYDLAAHTLEINDKIYLHGPRAHKPVISGATASPARALVDLGGDARISDVLIDNAQGGAFTAFSSRHGAKVERVIAIGAAATTPVCGPPRRPGWMRDSLCIGVNGGPAVGVSENALGTVPTDTFDLVNVTAVASSSTPVNTDNGFRFRAAGDEDIRVHATNAIAIGGTGADVAGETDGPEASVRIHLVHSDYASRSISGDTKITHPDTNGGTSKPPVFVNPAGFNYREKRKSVTVNHGTRQTKVLGPGKFDFDGEKRIGGGKIDIGADEYHR